MGIDIHIESNIEAVKNKMNQSAEERMLEATNHVRSAVLNTLTGSRTGRTYYVPGTRKRYTSSAPGEPPAQQLGDLRKSIKSGVEGEGKTIVGFVGTELEKGPMLEYGTRNMAARPWLRPSFEKTVEEIKKILNKVWFY